MKTPLVIFDLDGTLVDTAPDLIDSLNHTIAAADLQPVAYEDITHLVGQGVRMMIARAFHLRNTPLDDELAARLFDRFMAHYKANMPGKSKVYPGVIDCLDRLACAGVRLAVCTNKLEELALPLMHGLGLASRFDVITGGDTFAVRKPDAGHILGTIEKAGADPACSIMIGDSINDILAAQNARIGSIAVSFGYSDVPVVDLNADIVIDHFDDLTVQVIRQMI